MFQSIRTINDVAERRRDILGNYVDKLKRRMQCARQAQSDLRDIAANDSRMRELSLQNRQCIPNGTTVVENRQLSRADVVGKPQWQFATANLGKKRRLPTAVIGDPVIEKSPVPVINRIDFRPDETVIH
ncbi:MAG TPA: hypothetical protein VHW90_02890 [Stellaceae bacterium]|nr:hypothetical protein [Stellaceae bacterium]